MHIPSLAILAVLALTGGSVQAADDATPPPFFLQDPADNLCLAGDSFRRCSIETLWYVVGAPGTCFMLTMSFVGDRSTVLCVCSNGQSLFVVWWLGDYE